MPETNHFVNAYRTKEQRRVRYCFLRQSGLNRNLTRAFVGRRDTKIFDSLENLTPEILAELKKIWGNKA